MFGLKRLCPFVSNPAKPLAITGSLGIARKKEQLRKAALSGGGHGMRTPEAVTEISTFQGYGIGSDPMLSPTIPPYRDIRYSTYLISRLL